jgi:8-oxo-dGTP diphosphatase
MYPNHWDLIGGHCEQGETPEQTLLRELAEEIDVTATLYRQIECLNEPHAAEYGIYEYRVYLVSEWIGAPRNKEP